MSDNLPQRPHWRTRPSSPSCHVRYAERRGISPSRARHRVAELERDIEILFECYVAAGDVDRAALLLAMLESKLESYVPSVAVAAMDETLMDGAEDAAQVAYHLDPSDATARPLLRHLGAVLHRTQRLIGALRRAHPEA